MPLELSSLASRLEAVEERIRHAAARCGRSRADITLVAVTKKFSVQRIREAYNAGLCDFGENYVQEFADKRESLGDLTDARFHLIGHLQSNKARLASELFDVIQTVDSTRLLNRLDAILKERGTELQGMLEVKLSEEQTKTGARVQDLPQLAETAAHCHHFKITGLMTVPPWSEDPEQSRPYFRKLAELAKQYGWTKLSMGMSGDFEVAIEEGATMIRVGTALFGKRPKPSTE